MKTILFIGNSFTYYHNMPDLVAAKLEQAGGPHQVESLTKGGWFLSRFADPQDAYGAMLRENYCGRHWDILVLQDQSFNPVAHFEDFLDGARKLQRLLKPEKLLLYQTWAYEDGTDKLNQTGLSYEQMHRALKQAYDSAAAELGGKVVPVGDCFADYRLKYPEINLYMPDHYHPSAEGSNLAAEEFARAILEG
jgi:lysophospholipase L1-like esterase